MSNDSFKNFNVEPPSLDFLEDVYKAQLMAMSRVQPTLKAVENMNTLALDYSHLFKLSVPRFTVPTVNLGIDLEKLNEAISRINEPLIKARETVNSITSKQYRATLFSEETFNDVYNLSGISPEIIEHTVMTLRFNAEISIDSMHTSMKTKKIEDASNNEIFDKSNDNIDGKSTPQEKILEYFITSASFTPMSNIICNPSVEDLFVSNRLAFALVCIYIYICAYIRPYK